MFERLEVEVLNWAAERNLTDDYNKRKAQCLKTVAEVGELADAVNKNDYEEVLDGIGDVMVTLIILANLYDTSVEECLKLAYAEIKDRKGTTVDGVFIKEEDNTGC